MKKQKEKFDIEICRIGYGSCIVSVKATSQKEAEELALDEAGEHDYSEHTSDYKIAGELTIEEQLELNNKNKLLLASKCALADLEGIMPEFDPSGDREHPGWKTIKELKAAINPFDPTVEVEKDKPYYEISLIKGKGKPRFNFSCDAGDFQISRFFNIDPDEEGIEVHSGVSGDLLGEIHTSVTIDPDDEETMIEVVKLVTDFYEDYCS